MKDLMGMMGRFQEMQQKMEAMKDELANTEVTGTAGGGMVSVTLTAKGDMRGVKIDPSMFREDDVEVLEDLIVAAHADARQKGEQAAEEKMRELTAGLPIPPGMKLPF